MDSFGFTRFQSDNNISSSTKSFINDLSNAMDSRIAEINDQLQKSKRELLEKYKDMVDETDKNSIHMKDYMYAIKDLESNGGSKSIEHIKKFRDHLDRYLKDAGIFVDIYKKFSEEKLDKIINKKKGQFCFLNYKVKNMNKGNDDCTWNPTQIKQNFTLEEENKVMNVNYSSCYELYTSENIFKDGIHNFTIEVLCNKTTTYHSLGLVNESYTPNSNCVCCKNNCFFMFNRNGEVFNNGSTQSFSNLTFPDGVEPHVFDIEINLDDDNDKKWSFKFKEQEYGPFKLVGSEFKFATGMCNGGKVKYTLL